MNSSNEVLISLTNGVRVIQLNRALRRNAFTQYMYEVITDVLNKDAKNDKVKICVVTGTGEYFSAGIDLSSNKQLIERVDDYNETHEEVIRLKELNCLAAFINYPKLLIAVVNGPAIGTALVLLALCDIIYASESATFQIHFPNLSSRRSNYATMHILFAIFGTTKGNKMLFLNSKLTAREALQIGFVSEVFTRLQLPYIWKRIFEIYSNTPLHTILITKGLQRKSKFSSRVQDVFNVGVEENIFKESKL